MATPFDAMQYAGPRDPPLDSWYWWAFWLTHLAAVAIQVHLFLAFPTRRRLPAGEARP